MRTKLTTRYLAQAAIIAAAYAALSILLLAISFGPVQLRVAEALTVLPLFTPAAIPGLAAGCLIANVFSPAGLPDMIVGTLATLIGAGGCYALRKKPLAALLPTVLANALLVGPMLYYTYGLPISFFACIAWVGLGEAIACYLLGYPLCRLLRLHTDIFRLN